jgi:hypothetical protein
MTDDREQMAEVREQMTEAWERSWEVGKVRR